MLLHSQPAHRQKHSRDTSKITSRCEVFRNELVEEDVVLRTHSQTAAYLLHARADVASVDARVTGSWREHTRQDRPEMTQDFKRLRYHV